MTKVKNVYSVTYLSAIFLKHFWAFDFNSVSENTMMNEEVFEKLNVQSVIIGADLCSGLLFVETFEIFYAAIKKSYVNDAMYSTKILNKQVYN